MTYDGDDDDDDDVCVKCTVMQCGLVMCGNVNVIERDDEQQHNTTQQAL